MPSLRHRKTSAFTLIELLVVISIIALLISILLPALKQARATAITVQGMSNERQIGVAIAAYANDHGGYYPPIQPPGYGTDHYWWSFVSPYLGGKAKPTRYSDYTTLAVLRCPVQTEKFVRIFHSAFWEHAPSYGMNFLLGANGANPIAYNLKVRLQQVRRASDKVVVSEASYNAVTVLTELWGWGLNQAASLGYPQKDYQGGVHDGASNILWGDGHVSAYKNVAKLHEYPYQRGGPQDVWTPSAR